VGSGAIRQCHPELTVCFPKHMTLIDAAKCGMPHLGFYVLAIDGSLPTELATEEDGIVNRFRFSGINRLGPLNTKPRRP
jgi:hypothetical protein